MSFDEISLEQAAEHIYNRDTKEHFSEVLRCYNVGCYRASVVLLWTVTVFDLLKKLEELNALFEDVAAGTVLTELKSSWQADPTSSHWESVLVKKMRDPVRFLEVADEQLLESLKKLRHLCAHPVIDTDLELFNPTRDMARAHIRGSLEMILTKPPVLSAKITNQLLGDLSTHRHAFPTDKDLEQFLQARYLKNLPDREVQTIFRRLWKLVFKSEDTNCSENREINYKTLKLLFTRNNTFLQDRIKQEPSFYSKISGETQIIKNLISFLSEHPRVYPLLEPDAQVIIKAACDQNADLLCRAWFLQLDGCIRSHIEKIKTKLGYTVLEGREVFGFKIDFVPSMRTYSDLVEEAKRQNELRLALRLGISFYINAGSYADADDSFSRFIGPFVRFMEKEELEALLKGIENNGQTYGRGRAGNQHYQILERARTFFDENILIREYPKFFKSVDTP